MIKKILVDIFGPLVLNQLYLNIIHKSSNTHFYLRIYTNSCKYPQSAEKDKLVGVELLIFVSGVDVYIKR